MKLNGCSRRQLLTDTDASNRTCFLIQEKYFSSQSDTVLQNKMCKDRTKHIDDLHEARWSWPISTRLHGARSQMTAMFGIISPQPPDRPRRSSQVAVCWVTAFTAHRFQLTNHVPLVLWLRMHGAVPPSPYVWLHVF
jgi:hypothetical protein